MNKSTIKIFKKIFGNKVKINKNSNLNNLNKWDSLNHIKLIYEIEKVIKKKLNIKQVIQLTSVKKIDSLIRKNEKKKI